MGVGNVGCCDNTTALKNTEISIQSVTFRENSEDYYFASNTLIIPQSDNEIEFANLTKRIKRLKKLVKFPKLSLRFLSPAIEQALLVSPTGLFPSKRSSEDGYVFFGTKYKLNGSIVNDFKLPIQDSDKTKNVPGRYFMVYYDLKKSSYWIKDLGKGPGLFIKLDYALLMKDGMVLNIGNSYLQFNFTTKINSNPEVQVRKLGDENYQVDLTGNDCMTGVLIGRGHHCKIRIKDETLSKTHATLTFSHISGWVLEDGEFGKKISTNGTWLYAKEEFELYSQMFLKVSQAIFQVSLAN